MSWLNVRDAHKLVGIHVIVHFRCLCALRRKDSNLAEIRPYLWKIHALKSQPYDSLADYDIVFQLHTIRKKKRSKTEGVHANHHNLESFSLFTEIR